MKKIISLDAIANLYFQVGMPRTKESNTGNDSANNTTPWTPVARRGNAAAVFASCSGKRPVPSKKAKFTVSK